MSKTSTKFQKGGVAQVVVLILVLLLPIVYARLLGIYRLLLRILVLVTLVPLVALLFPLTMRPVLPVALCLVVIVLLSVAIVPLITAYRTRSDSQCALRDQLPRPSQRLLLTGV
ncbi:hypothetical protein F5880DRAFT_1602157 [Lentinula raphanica]|nr:hypothetical protein F5880DRAFT_1602157 [Lentinula raphanica]